MNLFQEVKNRINAKTVVEHYGVKVRSNGMACCPFHDDKHPSMKVDETYHCFACGASGDAIDFVARMFGLSQYDAALKLNQDFSLGIELQSEKSKPRKKGKVLSEHERALKVQKKIEEWIKEATDILIRYLKWIEFWKEFYKPKTMEEEWHPLFAEALGNEAKINYYLDILMNDNGEDILRFFEDKRLEVKQYGERITEYQRGILAEIRAYCAGGDDDD